MDSWVPANQEPIITEPAPAASARATSRGWRTPPSAQTDFPSSRAATEHSSTAENCGRPTPVCMRVVHMAPGPTPTFRMSAPAAIRSRQPSAVTTLPPTIRTVRPVSAAKASRTSRATASAEIIFSWWPCAVSMTITSAPPSRAARTFARMSPLMPTATPACSLPSWSSAGP